MFIADLLYSVLESMLTFIVTGLLQIPLGLLAQAFGVA